MNAFGAERRGQAEARACTRERQHTRTTRAENLHGQETEIAGADDRRRFAVSRRRAGDRANDDGEGLRHDRVQIVDGVRDLPATSRGDPSLFRESAVHVDADGDP